MKKRDIYWIQWLIVFFSSIVLFGGIFFFSLIQFNTSYIQEEKDELNVFQKQIIWAVTPYLKNGSLSELQKYGADFYATDVEFRIFDGNKNPLLTSNPENISEMASDDSKLLKNTTGFKIYRHAIKDKKIISVDEFFIGNKKYYIELTLSEEKVIEKIIEAQKNLMYLLGLYMFFIIGAIIQLIYQVRSSFNKLDDGVLKIANGELDTVIEIPKLKMLEELAVSVKKMTQTLKNQILQLKMSEEYKNEFIQNASHEMKTPLTAINMALELLENSKDEKQNEECLKIIHFQLHTMNKLVQDLLKLCEIDTEKTNEKKSFEVFNLNPVIKKVIDSFEGSNVKINLYEDENVYINGSEDLIISLIENLITNAIRYSLSDKIDVILKKDDNITIHIKDYGIGIKKEYQEKIFQKFYRIDKARSRSKGGSGLGLAIVKDIVELHNGSIEVVSDTNKGSDFIIKFPV